MDVLATSQRLYDDLKQEQTSELNCMSTMESKLLSQNYFVLVRISSIRAAVIKSKMGVFPPNAV